MPNQSKRKISGPSFGRMDRQKNMKRVKALRDSGQLKRDNPLSKLHNSIKGALGSLSRKTDSSSTRVIQGPKVKQLSPPTAQQAANKLIKAGQGAVKKTTPSRPVNSNSKDAQYTAKQREDLARLDKISPGLAKRKRARLDALLKRSAAK